MTRYGVDHSQRMSPDQTVTSEGLKRGQAKPVRKWLSCTEGVRLVPARITLDDPSHMQVTITRGLKLTNLVTFTRCIVAERTRLALEWEKLVDLDPTRNGFVRGP